MNTYNDNLRATVVASLSGQELDKKTIRSQAIASMFTLYHAEAATVDAQEKLDDSTNDLKHKNAVNDQAVAVSNLSNNMLSSATQTSTYLKQSVTNTSVCAANVQVATDAILKLAGDMGSVSSIVNAANFHSDISDLTAEARAVISDTAYHAEVTSDIAMQTSIATSEVAGTAVLSKAKNSNTAMANLLATTTSDFNTASQTVAADTLNVATTSIAEQVSEGNFEDIAIEYKATYSAYTATNKELNLNLYVSQLKAVTTTASQTITDQSRKITFNFIRSPFHQHHIAASMEKLKDKEGSADSSKPVLDIATDKASYPVDKYYVIVVKDQAKTTFTVANAENIILNSSASKPQFIAVPDDVYKLISKHGQITGYDPKKPTPITTADGLAVYPHMKFVDIDVNFFNYKKETLSDSDGDLIVMGVNYVVFVYATYQESYKRKINTFDDFLSAPSVTFALTHQLATLDPSTILFGTKENPITGTQFNSKEPCQLQFTLTEDPTYQIEYRFMFLPVGKGLPKGMVNQISVEAIEKESNRIIRVANEYDPLIAELEAQLAKPNITSAEITKLTDEINKFNEDKAKALNNSILASITSQSQIDLDTRTATLGYLFNMTIAEQVSPGNYISIKANNNIPKPHLTVDEKDTTKGAKGSANAKPKAIQTGPGPVILPLGPISNIYNAYFGEETTDIFGNLLKKEATYLPVVVSVYSGEEQDMSKFNNAWTGYTKSLVYSFPKGYIPTKDKPKTPKA
jgi:hypothetical protein